MNWINMLIEKEYNYFILFLVQKQNKKRKANKEFITIIIIMSCYQQGYPWPSLATSPNRSSPLAGPQGYIPYPHIAAVCWFELVVLLLLGHMRGTLEYITYVLVPASSAVSGSSNFDSFHDGRLVAVQNKISQKFFLQCPSSIGSQCLELSGWFVGWFVGCLCLTVYQLL